MREYNKASAFIFGIFLLLSFFVLGNLLGKSALKIKEYERLVTAKGLSEREYQADIVIWPIVYAVASNDLTELYNSTENAAGEIASFLEENGVATSEISYSAPTITDKSAQHYMNSSKPEFRYTASQIVTVYSSKVAQVRSLMSSLTDLGKKGIVFSGNDYENKPEYIFTRLNEVKPEMIEEATKKAREVAEKFASDSKSKLGKIKRASQGQFSIQPRDRNNPHIKRVRVVSTVEYYLSD